MKRAIILVSGGMDSCVTASCAKLDGYELCFLHINYGQRTENKELSSFNKIGNFFDVEKRLIIDMPYFNDIGGSCLTDPNIKVPDGDLNNNQIPISYVPFRNANILSAATSWAETINANAIYIGAVEEDSSGYPDCRRSFYDAFEKAIKKGTGDLPGVVYEDCLYEGYGPKSVAILIEVMTDNKNRTLPEIRSIMTKNGGNLGESGCVSWIFEEKGILTIQISNITEDDLMNYLDNSEVEDIIFHDDYYEIIIKPDDFITISKIFDNNNIEYDGEISLVAQNQVELSSDEADKVIKLLELIEEHEDVQKVHTNFEIK